MSENKEEIEVGNKVRFKKEYRKIAENLGSTGIFTVESVEKGIESDGVKFEEDKEPKVTINIDWLESIKEEKIRR